MTILFKYLKYVFYRAYFWQEKIQATENRRVRIALAYVTFLMMFNLLVVVLAVDDVFNVPISQGNQRGVAFAIFCVIVFYFLPEFVFIRNGRYKKIIAEFSALQETKKQARKREILIFSHYVATFILLIFFAVLHQSNH